MQKIKWWMWVILLLVLLVCLKFFFKSKSPEGAPTASSGPNQFPPSTVTGFITGFGPLDQSVFVSGTLQANESIELKSEISGRISSLSINEGQAVSKGTLLVKLYDADLQAQLRKLNAQIALASEKENRLKQLLAIQGVSKEEYEVALNQLQLYQADAEIVKSQIAKTELRAPFSGIIGLRYFSEGSAIGTQDVIATLSQTNPIKINFSIPERYFHKIKKGQKIRFTTDALADTFDGTVSAIEPQVESTTRSLQLRAIANNDKNLLVPGGFARVQLVLGTNDMALMIPTQAIIPVLKGQQVILSKGGKAFLQPVTTGIRTENRIQITEGLNAGDTVITNGIMGLKPGSVLKFTRIEQANQ